MTLPRSLAIVALLVLSACTGGGGGGQQDGPLVSPTAVPPLGTATAVPPDRECSLTGGGAPVSVVDFAYDPQQVTVPVNELVSWTNEGESAHTVTFDDDGPDCGRLAPSETVSLAFDTPGTYFYHCTLHPSMRASVVVQ